MGTWRHGGSCEMLSTVVFAFLCSVTSMANGINDGRIRTSHLRQDGGLCFEIPPWQLLPVELEGHLQRLRTQLANHTFSMPYRKVTPPLVNSEVARYLDTVLVPFLDAYHRNIQNAYQQLTVKILKRIKEEINLAVQKKNKIYSALTKLADELNIPVDCDEERRAIRILASKHIATIHTCIEEARDSITKMGPYAEQMILITKQHMQSQMKHVSTVLNEGTSSKAKDVSVFKLDLSRAAVNLGYELDLTLTNARRFSEQSNQKLTSCSNRANRETDAAVAELREQLYQCVYA